jgi:methyltransferase (TIGR00027 family)
MRSGQPSATARLIAFGTVLVARDPETRRLVAPEAAAASARFLKALSPGGSRLVPLAGQGWFRSLAFALERRLLPGIFLHYAVRKRLLEETTRAWLQDGGEQVVVLGAGFDTLAIRLHREYPHVGFIEIDHPASQQAKAEVLARDSRPGGNLRLAPADLGQEKLAEVLARSDLYRRGARTLFIAEGLLMYLAAADADRLFRAAAAESGPGSGFAFTFMERDPAGRIAFRGSSALVDCWLRWRGEPFRWGVRREDLPVYLRERGFALRELVTPAIFRKRYLAGLEGRPLAEGDFAAFAARAN